MLFQSNFWNSLAQAANVEGFGSQMLQSRNE
jgi:hypothetical protein